LVIISTTIVRRDRHMTDEVAGALPTFCALTAGFGGNRHKTEGPSNGSPQQSHKLNASSL